MQDTAVKAKARVTYIDAAKGLGIIFVVFAHLLGVLVYTDPKPFMKPVWLFLCGVTIAFFFITSGFTIAVTGDNNKDFKIFINRKLKSIMYPYAVFSVIYLTYKIVSVYIFNNPEYTQADIIKCLIDTITLKGNSVLWFLSSLFTGSVFYYFIFNKVNRAVSFIINFSLTIIVVFSSQLMIKFNIISESSYFIYFLYDVATMIIRCFVTAFCLNFGFELFHLLNKKNIKRVPGILLGFIFTILSMFLSQYSVIDFANNHYENPAFCLLSMFLGSLGLMMLVKNLLDISFLRFLGDKSLIIMLTHIDFKVLPYALSISYALNGYVSHAKLYVLYFTIFVLVILFEAFWIYIFDKPLKFLIRWTN